MTLISTNTSHKFGPDKTHFKSFIQYPPLRKVTEHSKKLFCRCCKKGLWLCCNRNNYQNTWQTSRAYFLLLELLFLFCEFLTQLIKYLEEKPYVGKTSIILSYFILIAAYTMYLTFYFMVLRITCLLFSYIHIQVLTLTKSRNWYQG